VTSSEGRLELNPAWRGDDELTISSVTPDGDGEAISVDSRGGVWPVGDKTDTVDLPLAWSPDGSALALRAVEGATSDVAGSYVEIMTGDQRDRVSDAPDVLIVGWTQ
jgi:hypothetical protein